MPGGPAEEYRRRLQLRRRTHDALNRTDARLSAARLASLAGGALLGAAGWAGAISFWWLLLPAGAFIVLILVHDRVIRDR